MEFLYKGYIRVVHFPILLYILSSEEEKTGQSAKIWVPRILVENLLANFFFFSNIGSKEPALQHGSNEAIDKLIRGCGPEISSEMCD